MKLTETELGYRKIEFTDFYGEGCSVQESSIIDDDCEDAWDNPGSSCLWIGIDTPTIKILTEDKGWQKVEIPHPEEKVLHSGRMHVDRKQVKQIRDALTHWLENKRLPILTGKCDE